MTPRDGLYLGHIRECIRRIEEYTAQGRERFVQSCLVQDAVMRNFEIIGEAVKQLSIAIRQEAPQIPWARIAGFRDVLIHGYMGIDVDEIWNVVERHLPDPRSAVEGLLAEKGR